MKNSFSDNEYSKFWINDNIIFCEYTTEDVDLNVAKIVTNSRLIFTKGKDYPALIDYTKVKSTTKEARDFFASKEAIQHFKALAVLINSPLGTMIFNFYYKISKPPLPTKVFTEEKEALEWLYKFK